MIEDITSTSIVDDTKEAVEPESMPEISFHPITGTNHPQTLCVDGKIKNKLITVLIDGGSTHNFIDEAIVSKLGLPVARDKKFQVMVANREEIVYFG